MSDSTILSLGAGVQSSVLLLLACRGILPKPDFAVFADTQWESSATYEHLWWLAEQATEAGIPVLLASTGNLKADMLRSMVRGTKEKEERWVSMPLYTSAPETDQTGMIRRQCTKEYKLEVIERTIRRDILGLAKGARVPPDVLVTQWIGISIDEKRRMRASDQRWRVNQYPLIGWPTPMLDRPWTRAMCQQWFADQYPRRALPRSACIGCPLHNNTEWRDMREQRPDEWAEAVAFDAAIRHCGGRRGATFVHRSCLPLAHVNLDLPDVGQGSLFDNACLGLCGL